MKIAFRAFWLATQFGISTGYPLVYKHNGRARVITFPAEFWPNKIHFFFFFFVAGYSLVWYVLNYLAPLHWIIVKFTDLLFISDIFKIGTQGIGAQGNGTQGMYCLIRRSNFYPVELKERKKEIRKDVISCPNWNGQDCVTGGGVAMAIRTTFSMSRLGHREPRFLACYYMILKNIH